MNRRQPIFNKTRVDGEDVGAVRGEGGRNIITKKKKKKKKKMVTILFIFTQAF